MRPIESLEYSTITKHKYTTIRRDRVRFPSGIEGEYLYVERDTSVAIISVIHDSDDLYTLLVRQFRYPIHSPVHQFPMGFVEKINSFEQQARNELLEETGYKVQTIECIAEYFHDPSLNTQKTIVYLVTDPIQSSEQHLDATEDIEFEKVPIDALDGMIHNGDICDALTISLVYLLKIHARR